MKAPAPLFLYIIALVTILMTTLRFIELDKSPPGFYVDESAIASHVICLQQSGHDNLDKPWPLFSQVLGGGYATPATLFGGAVWTSVFGYSIASFRSFAALHGALTVLGVFFLALALWGKRETAAWAALCCAISPWGFQFSRIAWDPPLAPCYLVWGLALILLNTRYEKTRAILGGGLLALAAYSYPPTRVQIALLLPVIFLICFFNYPQKRKIYFISAVSFLIFLIPLLKMTWTGEIQGRFNVLSIMSDYYHEKFGGFSWSRTFEIFYQNIISHFTPSYLFISGDTNLRHSTGFVGQWSWAETLACILAIYLVFKGQLVERRRELVILGLLIWGYFCGIIPAALTWESNPHALRSIGAQPFLALFAGYILRAAFNKISGVKPVIASVIAGFIIWFLTSYFINYPTKSSLWFDATIAETALITSEHPGQVLRKHFRDVPDIEAHARYFELSRGFERCQRLR